MTIRYSEGNQIVIGYTPEQLGEFNDPDVGECLVRDPNSDTPFNEAQIIRDEEADIRHQYAALEGSQSEVLVIHVSRLPVSRIRPSQISDHNESGGANFYANVAIAQHGLKIVELDSVPETAA